MAKIIDFGQSDEGISLPERETSLSERDIPLSEREISLSEREISVSEREISLSETCMLCFFSSNFQMLKLHNRLPV